MRCKRFFIISQHVFSDLHAYDLSLADFADDADACGKLYGMMICEKIVIATNSLFVAIIKFILVND
ncbi:hypothetical protein [Chryseobacterium sp. 22458]|uniref:hypothetical protein n=1 Tax=Chryseobacterium sp. 22458 TaxID=3453921 RepID=UPI003F8732CC